MSFKLTPAAALVAGAFSVTSAAHADEPAALPVVHVSASADQPDTARDVQPAVSTVGGKTATAVIDLPQTVTVVNKALMLAQGATSLADALRNVPGITLGGAEGGQIGNNINLRGFTARTDIYIDGFRDRGQYYRDTFDLEQVEVLQGPSSMLFGRGSTGGVINQVTKQAQLDRFTEISGTVGSDGRLRTTYDSNSQLSATAALRVNVFAQNLQTTRDTMQNRDIGFAPTVRFGIGQPTEVSISVLLQQNRDMPDYGVQSLNGRPVTPSRKTFYGESTDHTDQDIAMLNAGIKHRFNDTLTLRNQTQLNRYTTSAVETAPRALGTCNTGAGNGCVIANSPPAFGNYDPALLYVQMQSHDRNIVDTSIDNQTDLISRFNTGFIHHELILGLEVGHDTYRNQAISRNGTGLSYVNWVSLQNPDSSAPASVTVSLGNRASSSANAIGVYANDTLSLGEQWKLVTGIRHDNFRGQIDNSTSLPTHGSQSSRFTSYREGLLYQPDQGQTYYLSYGTSFNPLLEQMTLTNGTQNMPPPETRSYETGGKWALLDEKMSLAAAAFDVLQNNLYTKDGSGNYQPAGSWRIKGYTLSAAGRLTDKLQISSGYMHLMPRVLNPLDATNGSIPANTPADTLTLWASYDITRRWEIGGGPNVMSKRFVANTATNVNRVSVPAYTRWDATVAYHPADYEVRLNLLNLGNTFYYDALIASDGGRAVPGIGRTALLTATYRFR
ncbi:MAG: TonB-dependent siderophore receptor [bacterium]|nr:TonB-dependent siderophore receptor [bacterium]